MREKKLLAVVFVFLLLLFCMPMANQQIKANAESEDATVLDKLGGAVLPFFLSGSVFLFAAMMIYYVWKEIR